jgi:hypothetical protein
VWVHVAISAQPKKSSDAMANCLQNAVCWLLASLKRVSPCIECWSLLQIQCPFTLLSPLRIFPAYWVSLILSWMPFSSGRFARDLCMDTNPKRLLIFFSHVPLFVWVWSLSTIANPHFFNKLGGSCVLFSRGLWNLAICRLWERDWTVGVCGGHRLRT